MITQYEDDHFQNQDTTQYNWGTESYPMTDEEQKNNKKRITRIIDNLNMLISFVFLRVFSSTKCKHICF